MIGSQAFFTKLTDLPVAALFGATVALAALLQQQLPHPDPEPEILGWQTYCATLPQTQHSGDDVEEGLSVERIPVPGSPNHTLHMFSTGSEMRVRDLISARQWKFKEDSFVEVDPVPCLDFSAYGYTFPYDEGAVHACKDNKCTSINIAEDTWVYAYAASNDAVVGLTNYGEGLLFRNGVWCRMRRAMWNIFYCDRSLAKPLAEPSGLQFYSSVRWKGRTFVGEYPTGRLYQFDGRILAPTNLHPPFISSRSVGYEAQAMAVYCDNLFVGYWPVGEVWHLSSTAGRWRLAGRLFPDAEGSKSFIPYEDRPIDELPREFFGRRITSLIPSNRALFVSTSNYRGWYRGLKTNVVNQGVAEHYGAIFRLRDQGCSNYMDNVRLAP
jgi:hypothetical protein